MIATPLRTGLNQYILALHSAYLRKGHEIIRVAIACIRAYVDLAAVTLANLNKVGIDLL